MSRALVTYADGWMAELQSIAMPSLEEFAERHGYELVVTDLSASNRPPSWMKVPILEWALRRHDEALWVDADVVIADPREDLPVPDQFWQALAVHHTNDGEVPNCGVWFVRRPMAPVLADLWEMVGYIHHPWWEQGAMLELLGYDPWVRPVRLGEPTELHERTCFLGREWNSHPEDWSENPRFKHATMLPNQAEVMREWASTALT